MTPTIFIRRDNNQGWVEGKNHHLQALLHFKSNDKNPNVSVFLYG
jgi:hypothetical protein